MPAPPDAFFSVDIESDGPVPGPYSMLSFALVAAGRFDGARYFRPERFDDVLEIELKPISERFDPEALAVSGLSRERLLREGREPAEAMREAACWVRDRAEGATPVLVAYPLGFDWSFLAHYFAMFGGPSPFGHSRGFDLKTAVALTAGVPIGGAGRASLPESLRASRPHTHRAVDDAIEQAEILAKLFAVRGAESQAGRSA